LFYLISKGRHIFKPFSQNYNKLKDYDVN
jgi:hypothetical protein